MTSDATPPEGSNGATPTDKYPAPLRSLRLLHSSHRQVILVVLGLILLLQWSGTLYWLAVEGTATQTRAETVLRQLTVSVREQTKRMVRELDTALKTASFWLASHPDVDPRTDPEFAKLIELIREGSDGMIELRLLSASGGFFLVPDHTGGKGADVSDRKYFQIQQDILTRGMYVGEPLRNRGIGDLIIPVSYPLRKPVGGIIALFAAVRLDHVVPVYEEIRFKPNGTITLLRADGVVLAHAPFVEKYIGQSIAEGYDYLHYLSSADSGLYMSGASSLDGIARLVSFTKLPDYPLTVAVSAGGEDTFAAWHESRQLILMGGTLLSFLLIGGALGTFYVSGLIQKSEAQLQHLALYDALTGWSNRHAFDDAGHREFLMAIRYNRPLTVLSLDLDHFKRINDTYGHAAGDVVLRTITRLWADTLRGTDVRGRVGGEEFVVILPGTDAEQSFVLATRLLHAAREAVVRVESDAIRVTCSIGAATASPFDYTFEDVLRRSDAALYAAKRQGRDRVVVADALV